MRVQSTGPLTITSDDAGCTRLNTSAGGCTFTGDATLRFLVELDNERGSGSVSFTLDVPGDPDPSDDSAVVLIPLPADAATVAGGRVAIALLALLGATGGALRPWRHRR
jgi:hypothetical protein